MLRFVQATIILPVSGELYVRHGREAKMFFYETVMLYL